MSSRDESPDFLAAASFASLGKAAHGNRVSESFKLALTEFFQRHPEIFSSPQKIEFLQYCYKHYVNFDPDFRDLSVQEKLEQAAKMASEFWGKMFQSEKLGEGTGGA